jgi:hypothetical protein
LGGEAHLRERLGVFFRVKFSIGKKPRHTPHSEGSTRFGGAFFVFWRVGAGGEEQDGKAEEEKVFHFCKNLFFAKNGKNGEIWVRWEWVFDLGWQKLNSLTAKCVWRQKSDE